MRHRQFEKGDNKCPEWNKSYEQLKSQYDKNGIIGLIGARGGGKTQASVVMIAMNSNNGKKGLYTKTQEIFLTIRDAQSGSEGSLMRTFDKYIKPHLLVIDAFQVRSGTEFEYRTLVSILDKRYDEMKPTILISNDTAPEFLKAMGDDASSRMKEGGGIIQFNSTDFRGKK
jgi:DNA replication protein DnaC